MTEMTDEEFIAFMNANKDRMKALMGNDDSVKAFLKENAKKAKKKAEDAGNALEDGAKKVFNALFSTEVQKHMIGAGVELVLGINAILRNMPVPEKAQPIVDKMSEFRQNVSSVYCAKNPECPRKNAAAKTEAKKIELD